MKKCICRYCGGMRDSSNPNFTEEFIGKIGGKIGFYCSEKCAIDDRNSQGHSEGWHSGDYKP